MKVNMLNIYDLGINSLDKICYINNESTFNQTKVTHQKPLNQFLQATEFMSVVFNERMSNFFYPSHVGF